jgi:hypothetical protein
MTTINCFDDMPASSMLAAMLKLSRHPDFSITLNNVTSNNTLVLNKQPTLFARVSAFVLLVLVAYGAIAGAAHSHGTVTPQLRPGATEPTVSSSNDPNSSSKQSPKSGDCLVCQLQQHLYSGLLSALPHVAPPLTQFAFARPTGTRCSTQTYAPRRGRAPPISLS